MPVTALYGADSSVDYGTDVTTYPGLDETFTLISGPRVVLETVARRLSTPRGSLPFHPDVGIDLREYLNDHITTELLGRIKAAVEAEAQEDERVEGATATVSYDSAASKIIVVVALELATGVFNLVLNVSQVSIEVLTGQQL